MPRKRDLKICEVVTGTSMNLRARLAGETLLCTVSWMQNHKVNLKAEKIFWHMRQASKNLGLSCHHREVTASGQLLFIIGIFISLDSLPVVQEN